MRELVIDRKVWLRGENFYTSCLFRPEDGKRCCVGIYLQSLGVDDEDIAGIESAHGVQCDLPTEAKWLVYNSETNGAGASRLASKLYQANDAVGTPGYAREAAIAALFKERDVKVTFVGRSVGRSK